MIKTQSFYLVTKPEILSTTVSSPYHNFNDHKGFPRWLTVSPSSSHCALRPCLPSRCGSSSMGSNLHLCRFVHDASEVHDVSIPCLCSVMAAGVVKLQIRQRENRSIPVAGFSIFAF